MNDIDSQKSGFTGADSLSVTLFISPIVLFFANPANKYFDALSTWVIPIHMSSFTQRSLSAAFHP